MENDMQKETQQEEIKAKKKKKKKMSIGKKIFLVFCILIGLLFAGIMAYPAISNTFSDRMQSRMQTEYNEKIKEVDSSDMDEALRLARVYNQRLADVTMQDFDEEYIDEAKLEYRSLLNVLKNGTMGYIDIPIINVSLPIYHGDDDSALDRGVQHLLGTSLPVGGESTHAALSAHTGTATQKLFTDLTEVEKGDIFYVRVLNETLAYEVCQIDVVEPYDTSLLKIYPNEDYVTLITCTPYSVNTHRLLVRGTRITIEEAEEIEQTQEKRDIESPWTEWYQKGILTGLMYCAPVILIIIVILAIKRKAKKKKK